MLENSLFESHCHEKTRKPVTVVISATAHVVTILVLALIPLVQTQAITPEPVDLSLWAPKAETTERVESVSSQPRVQKVTPIDPIALTEPQAIPKEIAVVNEPPATTLNLPTSSGIGTGRSVLLDILNGQPNAGAVAPSPLPPPPPPPTPVPAKPVRIGTMKKANLIHQVNPVYPPLARQIYVQGTVILEAIIGKEGTIQNLRVISGHLLLAQAALDAVQQWRYRPTLLNGEPVEVITTITVNFTFQ